MHLSNKHNTFFILDDVEFEVSSDRRTGKPIAIKLVKIKPEIHPEERMNGQVSDFDILCFLRAPYLHIFHIRKEDCPLPPQFARREL